MGHGFVVAGVASGRGAGCGMWGRVEERQSGLGSQLVGPRDAPVVLQRSKSCRALGRPCWEAFFARVVVRDSERWFGRGLERCNGLQPRLVSSGFVSPQKQLSNSKAEVIYNLRRTREERQFKQVLV